ncbi:hypothetical protein B9Z19DRAFT_1123774 [Tuber borchii]|uniref:Uncharacterized protein n=1 Tax=Tuber borchii TaxID=42251 RepID=A0A2T6ZXR9_TUBBO|nr:hypothetical protein B9Z19DRAFT_1123774 [Tuber borchii]
MEERVYTRGNYRITIRASKSEHDSRGERGGHQREDARTHHRQPHRGSYSQNPASREHAQGQGYPKLTAENLATYQRQERGNHAPQVYREQEDDTAAQCGQWYPEEHRRRRGHFDDTAHAQHNQHTRRAAHHGHRQESGPYETDYGRATEGGRSRGEYVYQSYAQPRYQGEEYQRQHTHHATYRQPDRQELGQERFGYSYSYREEGSPRRRRASGPQARDVPEWVFCRKGFRNVEEKSEEGSIQCEIEEVE